MSNLLKTKYSRRKILLVAICSSLSGFLFGYDTGIVSSAILFMKRSFHLSTSEVSFTVSIVPFGAMITAIFSGYLSDLFGRRKLLYFSSICFVIGTLFCSSSMSFIMLIIGRLIIGFAIGIGSCISPIYTSEIAHKDQRGKLVNLFVFSIQLGILTSFIIGYLLSKNGNWQTMTMIGIVPAISLFFGVLFLDESPRWLVLKNMFAEAKVVLSKYCTQYETEKIFRDIKHDNINNKFVFRDIIENPKLLNVISVGIIISIFTQTVGINAFNYYSPIIFESTGFASPTESTFYTMLMGLSLVISTFLSLFYIDNIGRKKPLILGTIAIICILSIITSGFLYIKDPKSLGLLFFLSSVTFMIIHGLSIGPVCFLIPSEIFPGRIRGLGMGISIATNWISNLSIAALIPFIIEYLGIAFLFSIFLAFTIIGLILFTFFVPETKNTSLENIERNMLTNVSLCGMGNKYEK